jgi:hypothetical protein
VGDERGGDHAGEEEARPEETGCADGPGRADPGKGATSGQPVGVDECGSTTPIAGAGAGSATTPEAGAEAPSRRLSLAALRRAGAGRRPGRGSKGWRFLRLAAALALGLVGLLLVRPTLSSTPAPPEPWSLYLTTNGRFGHHRPSAHADWLLRMSIEPHRGCGQPTDVRGEFEVDGHLLHRPTFFALFVSGARLESARVGEDTDPEEVSAGESIRWRRLRTRHIKGTAASIKAGIEAATVVWGPIPQGRGFSYAPVVFFDLAVNASRGAGYSACYLTSPRLFDVAEGRRTYQSLSGEGMLFDELYESDRHLEYEQFDDGIVHMSVPGEPPDRSALDAGAVVRGDSLLLACGTELPRDPGLERSDRFYAARASAQQSSCGSVQTFRASGAADDLARRVFFGGILLSAALGLLLAPLVSAKLSGRRDPGTGDAPEADL